MMASHCVVVRYQHERHQFIQFSYAEIYDRAKFLLFRNSGGLTRSPSLNWQSQSAIKQEAHHRSGTVLAAKSDSQAAAFKIGYENARKQRAIAHRTDTSGCRVVQ